MVFYGNLLKADDEYVVVIPREEVERQGLQEGQMLAIEVRGARREEPTPEVRAAFEESWERNEAGYRYLADR